MESGSEKIKRPRAHFHRFIPCGHVMKTSSLGMFDDINGAGFFSEAAQFLAEVDNVLKDNEVVGYGVHVLEMSSRACTMCVGLHMESLRPSSEQEILAEAMGEPIEVINTVHVN